MRLLIPFYIKAEKHVVSRKFRQTTSIEFKTNPHQESNEKSKKIKKKKHLKNMTFKV